MIRFQHFTAPIEDTAIHFIHERSSRPDAIPLLILHGWPGEDFHPANIESCSPLSSGLFYDFHKIVKTLAHPDEPTQPAFHVVAPSLPGFAWSTLPRKKEFALTDIARIMNKLMTEVLDYPRYVGQGGDWVSTRSFLGIIVLLVKEGSLTLSLARLLVSCSVKGSYIMRFIGRDHYSNARLIHLNMFRVPPSGLAAYTPWLAHLPIPQSVADSITSRVEEWGLDDSQLKALRRHREFLRSGMGYRALHSTRVRCAHLSCLTVSSSNSYSGRHRLFEHSSSSQRP